MTRVVSFLVKPNHPDYNIAREQLIEARRLFNGLNAVARESFAYRKDHTADTHISKSLGLLDFVQSDPNLGLVYGYEQARKQVASVQGIVLPQKIAQRVGVSVANAWKSYYALKKNGRYEAKPPRFKQMFGSVEYTKQAVSKTGLKQRWVIPSGWSVGFALPDIVSEVQSARMHYSHSKHFVLEVIYNEEPAIKYEPISGLTAGIDLGVDSLATVAFSDTSLTPLRVDGRWLKSTNQFYNKRAAKYRSKLDVEAKNLERKLGVEKVTIKSQGLETLWKKRNRKVKHYLHSASKALVTQLLSTGVQKVIIGWSVGFKNKSNMGKRNNQNFVFIPHAQFRDMLKYKLESAGVEVIIQEESYTSKASAIDNDILPVYSKDKDKNTKYSFSGKRITRGQYKTMNGSVIHADVNGALNIIRKSNQPLGLGRGVVVMPVRLKFSF